MLTPEHYENLLTMIALRAEVSREDDSRQSAPIDREREALEVIAAIARGDVL